MLRISLRLSTLALVLGLVTGCMVSPAPAPSTPEVDSAPAPKPPVVLPPALPRWPSSTTPRTTWCKSGPAGTEWDRPYRSLIQTDADAVAKGLPTHADAISQILADAATSEERLQIHTSWVLYIKHFSQAYRPEPATKDLQTLYAGLVDMGLGAKPAASASPSPFDGEPGLTIRRDVSYGSDPLQRLDAYLVQSSRPAPVLVEIHGGGWRRGGKSQFDGVYPGDLIGQVLRSGISVVSIDYRLTPASQHPAQVLDAARAVQFIRAKAREWNIDPTRIAAMGGSAGAHMAAWVALHDDLAARSSGDAVERQSTRLSCFVDMWGPMDLTRADPLALSKETLRGEDFANAYIALFGTTLQAYRSTPDLQPRLRDASPLFLVTPDDPPALIISAGPAELGSVAHPPVPEIINDPHSAWHGVLLADSMQAAGVEAVRYIGPQVGKDVEADNARVLAFLSRMPVAPAPATEHVERHLRCG